MTPNTLINFLFLPTKNLKISSIRTNDLFQLKAYPDITDLNNNEIDDFQELFLNLLLDIKDGLCNQNRTS